MLKKRALEKKFSQGLGLEQGAASHPPDPHYISFLLVNVGPMCLLFLNWLQGAFCCLHFSFQWQYANSIWPRAGSKFICWKVW